MYSETELILILNRAHSIAKKNCISSNENLSLKFKKIVSQKKKHKIFAFKILYPLNCQTDRFSLCPGVLDTKLGYKSNL